MTLHIFNPEHDIALATNLSNFTSPHAGRQLRSDLGFLPALWAREGDRILVQHEESAMKAYRRVGHRLVKLGIRDGLSLLNPHFTVAGTAVGQHETDSIQPWGWDLAIRRELERNACPSSLLPAPEQIALIRQLSHRRTSARLLPLLQTEGTVGESFECTSVAQVTMLLQRFGRLVLKAPWSSSGRGVRFVAMENGECRMEKWVANILKAQGSIMAEPYYNKVKDFGMEFESDAEGHIRYLGLSLFHTVNGAYEGNILATEAVKQDMISRYVPTCLLGNIKQNIISGLRLDGYVGPFGIDMMIVSPQPSSLSRQALLHPCVEINLRRTMGHVALAISPTDDDIRAVMRVIYDGNHYKLKINKLR